MSSPDDTDSLPTTTEQPKIVEKPARPDKPTLNPIEQMFVNNYASPGSSTFANGAQSYLAVKPNVGYDTAKVAASVLLTRPNVSESITDILNNAQLGIQVRADSLKRIISHRDIGRSVSKVRHSEDETITETTTGPAYRDVIKAVDVLNKVDGTYDRNRAAADIASTEYKSLVRRFFSLSDKAPRRQRGRGGLSTRAGDNVSLVPKAGDISVGGVDSTNEPVYTGEHGNKTMSSVQGNEGSGGISEKEGQ